MTSTNKPGRTGLSRIFWATHYSWLGIKAAWKNEAAFRQELCLMLIMVPAAFWLGQTAVERVLLIAACLVVVIVELLNSAIEAVVDRIGTEMHPLSGQAKDMGSSAVFFALMLVLVTWGLIAWQRFVA
jgi:diacylglycerol kinase (ATP)